MIGWYGMVWYGMGCRCGRAHGFDSHQLNCAFSFSYFLIFVFPYFRIFVFAYFYLFIFSSFILSSYHIWIFYILYFISHIPYFIFSKMQDAWIVCIQSGRCFIEQNGYQMSQWFFDRDNFWQAVVGWLADVGGVAEVVCSLHINSTVLFLFLIFLFSYFRIFVFDYFHLFIFHPITFVYFRFGYLHISYLQIFKKCSAHE
jgi:hypothetical protein